VRRIICRFIASLSRPQLTGPVGEGSPGAQLQILILGRAADGLDQTVRVYGTACNLLQIISGRTITGRASHQTSAHVEPTLALNCPRLLLVEISLT